ncbi:MAG: prepilin-type N-terminal cleavage/methylation domain-containing protein [Sandaracinaceae bacterium]
MTGDPRAPAAGRDRLRGGFTLLEVMVAVAILSLAMVAIFSSQGGAVRTGVRARALTTATFLARCKMLEIEEQVANEGLPAISDRGEDGCCEDGEMDGYRCEWAIEQVILPDALGGEEEGDGLLDALGGDEGQGDELSPPPAGPDATVQDALSGAGSADMLGSLALQYAFPVLKPAIESQVRRATVTVLWTEGESEQSFDVVQFLVNDQGIDTEGLVGPNAAQTPGQPQGGQGLTISTGVQRATGRER